MRQDVDRAEAMVDDRTRDFREWWDSLDVVPLIAAIRQQAEEIRRDEVAKTVSKIKSQWPDDTEKISEHLDAMTSAQVVAAILVFRAVTYLLPIPLGIVSYLFGRINSSWKMSEKERSELAGDAYDYEPATEASAEG